MRNSFINYFLSKDYLTANDSRRDLEVNLISFNLICIITLSIFVLINLAANFWIAAWIDSFGLVLYFLGLYINKKTSKFYLSTSVLILTCCFILFSQQMILDHTSFHNFLFYPTLAVFSFALVEDMKLARSFIIIITLICIFSFFAPKLIGFTSVQSLTETEKSIYFIACTIASLLATYKIVMTISSERKRAYEKLQTSNEHLHEAVEHNKKLLALLVHDISNPLTVMQLSLKKINAEIQGIDGNSEIIEKFINIHHNSYNNLKGIIDSTRELMALNDGKLKLKFTEVDSLSLLEETLESFEYQLDQKHLKVEFEYEKNELPFLVYADPIPLKSSIFSNLISNAIKFSKEGGIIRIRLEKVSDRVLFHFIDEGVGIPSDLKDKLFTSSEVTSREGTIGEHGTGYGLPLVKTFVEASLGHIRVESKEDKGSRFTVDLKKI